MNGRAEPVRMECIACGVPVCVVRSPALPDMAVAMLAPMLAALGAPPESLTDTSAGKLFGMPASQAARVLYVRCISCDGFDIPPAPEADHAKA